MGIIKSMKLIKINKRIESINSLSDTREKINKCRELFKDVLKNEELYIVARRKSRR